MKMHMGGCVRAIAGIGAAALLLTGCPGPPPPPPGGVASSPVVGGCSVFPTDNPWNTDVSAFPLRSDSSTLVSHISTSTQTKLHPDFSGGGAYGIPYMVVPNGTHTETINYTAYGDESDPGPFPIPSNAPVEGAPDTTGDRHVLVVEQGACHLYELYRAFWQGDHWDADSGVNWDLSSNALRKIGYTSADAAGLPILAGLVRYDEVAAGHIDHALRFTVHTTQKGFILPATHQAGATTDASYPPMGLRLRLKANYDLSGFTGQALVILKALKKYGMIVADNGSSWFITGAADPRWDDNNLGTLKNVPGSAFEAVYTGDVQH